MITYVVCDLFESPVRVLVNTVNTVGVMGRGIAKDFKGIYPEMFRQYQVLCEKNWFDVGKLWLYKTPNKWILNFPTKRHWRSPSRPEYVEAGLKKFIQTYHQYGITSISFPLLGCGNGELDWETQVRPLMERYLETLPITVFTHLLHRKDPFTPEHRNVAAMRGWLRGEPESLPFSEVWDDLRSSFANPTNLRCFDTTRKAFSAEVNTMDDGIALALDGETIVLPSEALMDLWQQIRQSGFVSGDSMPCGLDTLASFVVPIMTKLAYVKPVLMANRYRQVNKQAVGLRLVPRAQATDGPLLASVGAVERG